MGAYERRMAIWHTLCRQGQATTASLAAEYKVSPRTIRTDVDVLSRTYPIITIMGRHGCYAIADWYKSTPLLLTATEFDLLYRIQQTLTGDDALTMNFILTKLTDPSAK